MGPVGPLVSGSGVAVGDAVAEIEEFREHHVDVAGYAPRAGRNVGGVAVEQARDEALFLGGEAAAAGVGHGQQTTLDGSGGVARGRAGDDAFDRVATASELRGLGRVRMSV